jgi:hypothetical protein
MLKWQGDRPYAYRSVRRDGRVVTEYVAAGPAALLAEAEAAKDRAFRRKLRRADRRVARAAVAGLERVGRLVARLSDRVDRHFREAMHRCGWYAHRWAWRRGRVAAMAWDPKAFEDEAVRRRFEEVFEDARAAEAARRLFEPADDVPALVGRLGGGLAKRVRDRLVERLSPDPAVREAVRGEVEALRRDLEGPAPTTIEHLIVERVVVAWLAVGWLDLLYFGLAGEFAHREVEAHVARMRSRANRDYLAGLKALALVRRAAPAVTVNTNKTVNVNKKGGRGRGGAGENTVG